MTEPAAVRAALAAAYRSEWGAVFGTIVRLTGDWMLAEDCAQDAFARALPAWQRDGVPRSPGAWLTTAARRRAVDVLRRSSTEQRLLAAIAAEPPLEPEPMEQQDERLRLIFTCCHPALPMEARVPLTLRTVAGLTMREIARAFLVGEATVSQRILRAKRKIAEAGIPYRVPPAGARADRLAGVLAVLSLIFTEGYAPSDGSGLRTELAEEAIRLARLVRAELPGEPEAAGLLGLLLLQHARRDARLDAEGRLVRLEQQDRSRWDRAMIAEGAALARTALPAGGHYALQAALAAEHSLAARADATDWAAIVQLYDRLLALRANPVVSLNRAVAVGMRDGAQAGLDALDALGEPKELAGSHGLAASRGDALQRLGRTAEAVEQFRLARSLAPAGAIAEAYGRRIAELAAG